MMMARPTTTSAAATTMTKNAMIWPSMVPVARAKVTSALLITAAVGAMVLAHIEREPGSRQTQKELSRARFLTDRPQTLPGPGVYARANSVATPALLPDGSTSEETVATGMEAREVEQMPRPTGREQLGSPDASLGSLEGPR